MSIKAKLALGHLAQHCLQAGEERDRQETGSELGRVALDSGVKALTRTAEGALSKIGQRTSSAGMAPRQNVDLGTMGRASMMKAATARQAASKPMHLDESRTRRQQLRTAPARALAGGSRSKAAALRDDRRGGLAAGRPRPGPAPSR